MNNDVLCMRLIKAESEEEVIRLLSSAGFWDNADDWRDYGNNPMNFSQIGNQQSLPESALVEKLINSVDAMLMRACILRGLNPQDTENVPGSIREATESFFGVKRGDLSNLPARDRSELADNIILVATGSKGNPNYLVIDKGEGQSPSKFPDTLVSLNKENKVKIPFVQGKFNMGSTGVLQFCGERNLQLIVSKRDPRIMDGNNNDPISDHWGFTIVRRMKPEEFTIKTKNSIYRYLAPKGQVLSFKAESLKVLPGQYPYAYVKPLEWGTLVKLYEYKLAPALKTNILFDLNYRLSLMMPEVALPIRLYERREGYTGHTMESTLAGLVVRMKEDRSANLEAGFPASLRITVQNEQMPCSIYAFKKGASKTYIKGEGVVLIVNGQAHGFIPNAFFRRQNVGMSYLSDSLLVLLDCSSLSRGSMEDLFMNSRDRLRDIPLRNEIESTLEEMISNHPGLRALREKRRREEISNSLDNSKPLKEALEKIIKKSPSLASLFSPGKEGLHSPFDLRGVEKQDEFKGRTFPKYFKLISNPYKRVPKNHRFRMQYETDASNDYFDRLEFSGEFFLRLEGKESQEFILNLWNGIANLTMSIPEDAEVGDILKYTTEVKDKDQLEPFTSEFQIEVLEPAIPSKGISGDRVAPPSSNKGEDRSVPTQLELPQVTEVYKKDWGDEYDDYTALKIQQAEENSYDFYVNMDNRYMLAEIKSRSRDDPQILKAQFKFALVLVGLGILFDQRKHSNGTTNDETLLDEIEKITRGVAAVLLPMLNDLSALIPEDE